MKLLNLVYDKNWSIKEGELQKDEYSLADIVFLFGDTDAIKDEKRFFELTELFPNAKIVRLERNYRSTANILAAASNLISHNHGRLGKTLKVAENSPASKVEAPR